MADQASVRTNGFGPATGRMTASSSSPGAGASATGDGPASDNVVENVAGFGEDLLTLAELQGRLAAMELKQSLNAARFGSLVFAVGLILALAALPVGLLGIAEMLVEMAGLGRAASRIVVAVASLAIAVACFVIAALRLRGSDIGFPLSREEFTRNLNWVRTVILHSGRSARRRR